MLIFLFIISLSTLTHFVTANQYPFVFACEKDASCSSGYRRIYCGYSGYSHSQCAPSDKTCETNFVVSLNVSSCETDEIGNSCPSKVCETVTDITLCTESIARNLQCLDGRKLEGECTDCSQCDSGKCLIYGDNVAKICYPLSRCYTKTFHADFYYCPEDKKSHLQDCECCSTQDKISQIKTQCSEGSDFLTQDFLTHYNSVKNSFSKDISSTCENYKTMFPTSFEAKVMTSILGLMIGLVFLLNG